MVKNHNLAQAISDVSWSKFKELLTYKCDWYGKNLIEIGRFQASSQICSNCGLVNKAVKNLKVREWDCPECGILHDRDINASKNIRAFGLALVGVAESAPTINKSKGSGVQ
jgi:putative transposase